MKCPVCSAELATVFIEKLGIDACESGCGGIWFDNFELQKVDDGDEQLGERILSAVKFPKEPVAVDPKLRRKCPKCEMIMMRRLYSPNDAVEIDECPSCAGIWLDLGELSKIRGNFANADERKAATEKFLHSHFDSQFEAMRTASEAERATMKQTAKALRVLCPSYYLSGK